MPENVQINLGIRSDSKQAQQDVTSLSNALKTLQTVAVGVGKGNNIYDYGKQIKAAANEIAGVKSRMSIAKAFEDFNQTPSLSNLVKFSKAVESEYNRAARGVKEASRDTADSTKKMGDSVKAAESPLHNFAKSLMRIAKLRFLRGIIRSITSAFREGTENIYRYSVAMGSADASHFASTMDSLASSLLYMKNSIGAVVAPLLTALLPAIQTIINWFALATKVIAQFFAVLGGQSTYTVAKQTATTWKDVGGAIGGAAAAAQEYKNTILGFDELNVLNDPSSGGGGGGGGASTPDYSDMFEELEVPQNLITKFAEFVKPVIQGIAQFAKDSVNGFIDGFPAAIQFAKGVFTGSIEECAEALKKFRKILMENKTANFLFNKAADIKEFLTNAANDVVLWILDRVSGLVEWMRPFLEFIGIDVDKITGKIAEQRKVIDDNKFAIHQNTEKWRLWANGVDYETIRATLAVEKAQREMGGDFGIIKGSADGAAAAISGIPAQVDVVNRTGVNNVVKNGLDAIYTSANRAKWELYGILDYVAQLSKASLSGIQIAVGFASGGGAGRSFEQGGYVPVYASGGIHNTSADLFIANESSNPELVGRIGSRTAVANQGQMVEALASGIYRAMTDAQSGSSSNVEVVVQMDGVAVARANDRGQKALNRRFNVQLA